jgi:hypothetical protein
MNQERSACTNTDFLAIAQGIERKLRLSSADQADWPALLELLISGSVEGERWLTELLEALPEAVRERSLIYCEAERLLNQLRHALAIPWVVSLPGPGPGERIVLGIYATFAQAHQHAKTLDRAGFKGVAVSQRRLPQQQQEEEAA